ncbi:hypothetical protein HYFRA_00010117 [Hymenoscyphus fraxineus]|uniref:Major facilitator superfamily (MFS) profile domain-containing protein n=1 Tax=Hymenoscyphus fraxineus TaxID=746836 RepID=A0A9N9KWP5_9HELO|nr:hypothetical protein HYFRA_00010117 [Hymenoscyphus fraxineus]
MISTNAKRDALANLELKPEKPGEVDAQPDSTTGYVVGFKLASILGSVSLACFLMLLDTMVISTAIPSITDTFNSLPDIGWYASAYQFGSAAPQPLTGKVYTHFNTKWSFLFFFGVFEIGSLLCGAALSSNMLIIGRAVAGFGAAGIINGALTIISSCVPMKRRPALIGLTMGLTQLGVIAGPLIGGAFTSYTTWRWCFYINLPLGIVPTATLLLVQIPEQTPKRSPVAIMSKLHKYLDLIGFALFSASVLQLLLALQYGGSQYLWNSSRVIGLFCGSIVTFIVWILWNHCKGEDALMPASMVRQREVWSSGLYQSLVVSAMYGATFYLPIYFQAINQATAILSGVYLLPAILSQLVAAGLSGLLLQKIGYVIPLAIFGTVLLSIGSGIFSILQPGSPIKLWVGLQILTGTGAGLSMQLAIMTVQAVVGGELLSSGMAFVIFAQSLGPAIILVLCNVIFSASLSTQLQERAPQANAEAILSAGATGFRAILKPGDLPGVLLAYANSVGRVFYLVASVASASVLVLWGMGWRDIRKGGVNVTNNV